MLARFAMIAAVMFVSLGSARAEHVFYVHDCCIKDANDPKVAAYEAVVEAMRREGFTVAFDLKTGAAADGEAATQRKAAAIADQVLALMAGGEFAENITVVGHGSGATAALIASGLIANRRVNYALLGGCPRNPAPAVDYAKVMGRFLSIMDTRDAESGSCQGLMREDVFYKEFSMSSPEGGSLFLRADGESLNQWWEPIVSFATGKGRRGRR
jgi:hypothetical protein